MGEREYLEYYALKRRGVSGWFKIRGYVLERKLYLFHRITGILIVLFMLPHFYSTGWHPGLWWDALLGIIITFHVANGIRLTLLELLGIGVGKPLLVKKPFQRPVSIEGKQRYLLALTILLFLVLAIIWSYYAVLVKPLMGG
ncbi:MAG: hypothetical protein QW187_03865 [Candidatus Korarchaeum sp.]